jgi:uncharacterized protein YndB with AHSA1/START domain
MTPDARATQKPLGTLPDHVISIYIDVPEQLVWDEITKTGRIQKSLYNTVLETDLRPGSRLRYYRPDRKRVFIVGEVVAVEPPHKFSHTYMVSTSVTPFTLVTWKLREKRRGCRVTVTHSGWTKAHKAPEKVAAGWREILSLLEEELETGDMPRRAKVMCAMYGLFLFMMPKSTTTGYVDEQGWCSPMESSPPGGATRAPALRAS